MLSCRRLTSWKRLLFRRDANRFCHMEKKTSEVIFFFNAQGGVKLYNSIPASFYFFHSMCVCVCVWLSHNPLFFISTTSPTPNLAYFAPLCFELFKMLHFWSVVLEKTLESPLDARTSNQSTLKEINPEYSLEGRMLKLKVQYFGHLMLRANSLEKTLMQAKIEGRRREWQRMK